MNILQRSLVYILAGTLFFAVHWIGITYGTGQLPLHQAYVGDEQSPVNAAFHALQEKSLLGFRNNPNLYYGPLFATIAIPPVLADFGVKYLTGVVHSPDEYAAYILWDWSGIEIAIRIVATLVGFAATYVWFLIVREWFPRMWMVVAATLAFAFNYYVFEYSHFFKHWVFVVFSILLGLWALDRLHRASTRNERYIFWTWAYIAGMIAFGISYVSGVYQIIFVPYFIAWVIQRRWDIVTESFLYGALYAVSAVLFIFWHPYAFIRLLGGNAFVVMTETAMPAWQYYSHEVLWNHILLIIGAIVLVGVLWVQLRRIHLSVGLLLSSVTLMALSNVGLFIFQPRAEGRYMLPTIIGLLLVAVFLVSRALIESKQFPTWQRRCSLIGVVLICLNGVVHGVHVAGWNWVYAHPNFEQRFIVQQLAWEREHPDARTLIVAPYLLGHAHSPEAYRDYIEKSYKTDVNLYDHLLKTTPPVGIEVLNVYYGMPDRKELSKTGFQDFFLDAELTLAEAERVKDHYDRVVIRWSPRAEPNQFDYIDYDMTRVWNYNDYFGSFEVISERKY